MPLHEKHKQQRGKNLTLLLILLVMIGIVYAITVLKMMPSS